MNKGESLESEMVRFYDRQNEIIRKARRVAEELDNLTMPGVPTEISEEDSLVTTTAAVLESQNKVAAGG